MPADPLAHLRDLHLPPPIPAWPPALGGLLLLLGLAVGLLLLGCWRWHRYRQQRPLREARALLDAIVARYLREGCLSRACADINTLLKRVSLVVYPRVQVASLHGDAWIQFLQATLPPRARKASKAAGFEQLRAYLLRYPYQPAQAATPPAERLALITPFHRLVQRWIAHQGRTA